MKKECSKCKVSQKQIYSAIVGHKLRGDFCSDCINKWFDIRDKLVEEAFRDYISVSKSK